MKFYKLFFSIFAASLLAVSCGEDDPQQPQPPVIGGQEEPVDVDANGIWSRIVRTTSSTITVSWTTEEKNKNYISTPLPQNYRTPDTYDWHQDAGYVYRVGLYSDEACNSELVSWTVNDKQRNSTVEFDQNYPPRFVFSGLKPSTVYYVKITNLTTGKGMERGRQAKTLDPLTVGKPVSSGAGKGDLLLAESFDKLVYGGDLSTFAAGYSRLDRAKLTAPAIAKGTDPDVADNQYYTVSASTEMGLFNTLAGLLDDYGLSDWSMIPGGSNMGAICARPGYLKVGANSQHAYVLTPVFTMLDDDASATVSIRFKAAPYGGTTIDMAEKMIAVAVFNGGQVNSSHVLSDYTAGESVNVELSGERGSWKEYSVSLSGVTRGSRIGFGGIGTSAQSRFMLDDIQITCGEIKQRAVYKAAGRVIYADGSPAAGVSVSDGFEVAVTDADGRYSLTTRPDTWYIYVLYPSDARMSRNSNGQPDFFKQYSVNTQTYDFKLGEKMAPESQFSLFAMADPQAHYAARNPQKMADTDRFLAEAVPSLNTHIAQQGVPCYGVTLGDVVYSEGSRNSVKGMATMRSHFSKVNMPVYQTMGNHDFTYFYTSNELKVDDRSSTLYLRAQREFENVFGPVNSSFNRGDAHIVCMRNIIYDSSTNAASYHGGFTDEQFEWLKADLANVPKSKMVILCVHIPFVGLSGKENVSNVLNLLKQYTNSTIFSGHTHYYRGVANVLSSGLYEHVHSAVCGQWWWSRMEGDGCPNGYTAYRIQGNSIKNAVFYGFNEQMNNGKYQIRMYQGDLKTGGAKCYFQWPYEAKTLLINVFNGDARWSVKVYEDGVYKGLATLMSGSKQTFNTTAGQTYAVNTSSSQDWWAVGYHIGVVGRGMGSSTSYYTANYHMYKFTRSSATSKVTVEATDPYGNVYTCDEVMTTCNYPSYVTTPLN